MISAALANETDQYYGWGKPLADGSDLVNARYNLHVQAAITRMNAELAAGKKKARRCGEVVSAIAHEIHESKIFRIEYWEKLNEEGVTLPMLPSFDPESRADYLKNSIYAPKVKLDIQRKYIRPEGNAETLSMGGVRFGLDKILHLNAVGYMYYKLYHFHRKLGRSDEHARQSAVQFGVDTEKDILGTTGTGVFSYADLEANYDGFELFRSLCGENGPARLKLLGEAQGERWELDRPIDLREYVTPDWDESFNPSAFSPERWRAVRQVLPKYCGYQRSAERAQAVDEYRRLAKPSFSKSLVLKWRESRRIADPKPHSLERICRDGLLDP
jgi:hypothetical protein